MPQIIIKEKSRGGGGGGGGRLLAPTAGFDATVISGEARVDLVSLSALKVVFGEDQTQIYTDEDAIDKPTESE